MKIEEIKMWKEIAEKSYNDLKEHGRDASIATFTLSIETYIDMMNTCLQSAEALENVRKEIKEWYFQADKQALAKDPCVVDAMIDLFIRTIKKYKITQ